MNAVQQKAFVQLTLIDPIGEIVSKLENNEFRDKDVCYLEEKLSKYMGLAAKTFDLNFILEVSKSEGETLNDFLREKFLNYFKSLYEYFTNLNN